MSSSDALIQSLIRAAELSTPDQGLEIKVVAPATPSPDVNERAYVDLRSRLAGKPRMRLEQDYSLWCDLHQWVQQIKEWIQPSIEELEINSPLHRRVRNFCFPPPTRWKFCEKCKGTGEGDIGYCRGCEGNGYNV